MKRTLIFILLVTTLTVLMTQINCKKSDTTGEYLLYVKVHDGVTGSPEAGAYYYNENEQVTYSYDIEEGYENLTVMLDGEQVEASGTITITGDHGLEVFASDGSGEYLLRVSHSEGVTGTPETGFYYHNIGDQIDYSFSLEDGFTNLRVLLDGEEVESSGTVTISDDHTLVAYSSKEYYIQGTWDLIEAYDDGSSFEVTLTFTGATENGTVIDSHGGSGTYTVDANSVTFTLEFPEVTYEYTGTFSDDETMGGEAKRYISADTHKLGNWIATMVSNSSSQSNSHSFSPVSKGKK